MRALCAHSHSGSLGTVELCRIVWKIATNVIRVLKYNVLVYR